MSFSSRVIFTINENKKYSYNKKLSCMRNIIRSKKKQAKYYKINKRQYRRWARTQRSILNKKGRESQRNINYQKICIRPKPVAKHIKLKNKIQKQLTYSINNLTSIPRSKPVKIMEKSMIYNKDLKKFMIKYSF